MPDASPPPALPDYATAFAAARSVLTQAGPAELVPLAIAAGRVLREAVVADRDLPPFNRAQMDGYALRHTDLVAALAAA